MSDNGRHSEAHRREFVGEVVSNKMQKTVVVVVKRFVRHHRYGKVLRRVTRLKAHDEKNECQIGDRVRLVETRPLSKDKHFRIVQIVEKARVR
jgi:small subunit ribosomal protein S17